MIIEDISSDCHPREGSERLGLQNAGIHNQLSSTYATFSLDDVDYGTSMAILDPVQVPRLNGCLIGGLGRHCRDIQGI